MKITKKPLISGPKVDQLYLQLKLSISTRLTPTFLTEDGVGIAWQEKVRWSLTKPWSEIEMQRCQSGRSTTAS